MGGNLAWTIRLSDGTQYRMDRWTNSLPQLHLNPAFLDESPEGINKALAAWREMKADWDENHERGTYEHLMTQSYAPYPFGLRPSEYGLIVTCFKTKTILSLQGYTDLSRITEMRLWSGPDCDSAFPGRRELSEALRAAGRIACYTFVLMNEKAARTFEDAGHSVEPHPHGGAWIARAKGDCDYKVLTELCDGLRKRDTLLQRSILEVTAQIDLAPFTLREFSESTQGMRDLRAAVIDLGFEIEPEFEADWTNRIAEMAEWDDEDGVEA